MPCCKACVRKPDCPFAGLLRRCSGFFCGKGAHSLFQRSASGLRGVSSLLLRAAHTRHRCLSVRKGKKGGRGRRDMFFLEAEKAFPAQYGECPGSSALSSGRAKGAFCGAVRPLRGKTVRTLRRCQRGSKVGGERKRGEASERKKPAGREAQNVPYPWEEAVRFRLLGMPVRQRRGKRLVFRRLFHVGHGSRCMTEKAGFSETGLPVKNKEMDPWGGSPTSPPLHEPWRAFPTTSYPSFSDDAHAAVPCR